MVGWSTVEDSPTVKPTLVKRAMKRTGFQIADNEWVVLGDEKLSDTYSEYNVSLIGGEYRCSCQGHAGGQYRKRCSHITYVVLAKAGKAEWSERAPKPVIANPHVEAENIIDNPPFWVDPSEEEILDPDHTARRRAAIDEFFGTNPPLPAWVTYLRGAQWKAMHEIDANFKAGHRIQIVEAPTGTGKTLMAEVVRRFCHEKKTIYTCMTRSLQEQQANDFPYANIIWGKNNYNTADRPDDKNLNAGLCTKEYLQGQTIMRPCCPTPQMNTHCAYCHPTKSCPYEQAKNRAAAGQLAVANMAYLLNEWKAPTSRFANWNLLIVDEADELENQLMSHIEVKISKRMREQLGLSMPQMKTVGKYRDGPKEWKRWIDEEALPAVNRHLRSLPHPDVQTAKQRAEHLRFGRVKDALQSVSNNVESEEEGGWVYTGYQDGEVIFKPVKVSAFAKDLLFNQAGRIILMSATVISAEQMASDLGLDQSEYRFVATGSGFPPERRPIYVERTANVTKRGLEDGEAKPLIDRIAEIYRDRSEYPILVHTVSYKLNKMIYEGLKSRGVPRHLLFTYYDASAREGALAKFRASGKGILLAPSFERGIDLKGDECRVVIVAKIPFPYLGDHQVQARMHTQGGSGWYQTLTIRSLVQMTGRAMRSKDDWCETFILDKQFNDNILSRSKRLLPEWWREAIVPYKKGRRALEATLDVAEEDELVQIETHTISW